MDFGGFGGTWIWKHYTKIKVKEKHLAKCIHCSKKFSSSGGKDTLFDHARSVHGYLPPVNQHEDKSSETSDEAVGTISCKDALERNVSHSTVKQKASKDIATHGQHESNSDLTSHGVGDCLKPKPEENVLHSKADSDSSEDEFVQFNEDMYDENEEIIHKLFYGDDSAGTSNFDR